MSVANPEFRDEIRRKVAFWMDSGVPMRCISNVMLMGAVSEQWLYSLISNQEPAGFGSCEKCGRERKLHNHHLSYAMDKVIKLCHKCHMIAHSGDKKFDHRNAIPIDAQTLKKWFPGKKNLKPEIRISGSVRLNSRNGREISEAIDGTLVSANKAVNIAIKLGLPMLLKQLGKKSTQAK